MTCFGLVRVCCGLFVALMCAAGVLVPGSLKASYPRVFDAATHWLQLRWSIHPEWVAASMPRLPARLVRFALSKLVL